MSLSSNNHAQFLKSQSLFKAMFEDAPFSMAFVNLDGFITKCNRVLVRKLGFTEKELLNKHVCHVTHPDDLRTDLQLFDELVQGKRDYYKVEKRFIKKDGSILWGRVTVGLVHNPGHDDIHALGVMEDITECIYTQNELSKSQQSLQHITESMLDMVCSSDLNGTFLYTTPSTYNILGYSPKELIGTSAFDLLHDEDVENCWRYLTTIISTGQPSRTDFRYRHKDGHYIWMEALANPIKGVDGNVVEIIFASRDITKRKEYEKKLIYLNQHDSLTRLYNRAYFENQLVNFDNNKCFSIIMCDIDGLKLVNDTFGHVAGDKLLIDAASVILESFPQDTIVARIGGDEIAILWLNPCEDAILQAINYTNYLVNHYNNNNNAPFPLSISVGYAIGSGDPSNVFKEADNNMYKQKLTSRYSSRSSIVKTLKRALEARDYITEGHGSRLQDLVIKLAKAINLKDRSDTDLKLLAQFHDIGKVGIPDSILFKPGRLTEEEFTMMKRHSEIGHRIAKESYDLLPIADLILHHHEWWNGTGYPLGFKGAEIPIECRILAICDAYDAMTNDRPYRKALAPGVALAELKKCSGTQFDPDLVVAFVELINSAK